jgi:hypothetical protein
MTKQRAQQQHNKQIIPSTQQRCVRWGEKRFRAISTANPHSRLVYISYITTLDDRAHSSSFEQMNKLSTLLLLLLLFIWSEIQQIKEENCAVQREREIQYTHTTRELHLQSTHNSSSNSIF